MGDIVERIRIASQAINVTFKANITVNVFQTQPNTRLIRAAYKNGANAVATASAAIQEQCAIQIINVLNLQSA